MGGTIAVTLREEDGTEHRMARWTNILPYWRWNRSFIQDRDSQEIGEFLEQWEGMREDYLSGPPYEHRMSKVYGHYTKLAPYGYGLVVFDFQEDKIYSNQGYSDLTYLGTHLIRSMISPSRMTEKVKAAQDYLEWAFAEDRVEYLEEYEKVEENGDSSWEQKKLYMENMKELKNHVKQSGKINSGRVKIDESPLEAEDYIPYNEDELDRMENDLRDAGFDFSEEEEKQWEEFQERK